MPMVEDLDVFFDAEVFGTEAIIDHDIPVTVNFKNGYTEAFDGVATFAPECTLPTAAAPLVAQGQELRMTRDGEIVRYTIRSVEPYGTGVTRLTLVLS